MSLKRKVTVPVGRSAMAASFGPPGHGDKRASCGWRLPPLQFAGSRTTTAVSFWRRAAQPSMFSPL